MAGRDSLSDALRNKGTAFTRDERTGLRLEGLLPPRVESLEEQAARVHANLQASASPLDKYLCLAALQEENATLFYRVLLERLEELLPVVYTPTSGRTAWAYRSASSRSTRRAPACRADLAAHKRAFAQERAPAADLREAIESFRPTALVGATGSAGLFTQPVLAAMARVNERPVVLALSNPTSKAECTAGQAYAWTQGRALFAAGSPFPPVTLAGRAHAPGQANNSYIFPGVGLGLLASGAQLDVAAIERLMYQPRYA